MQLFRGLLDLVLPVSCAGCGATGRVWCASCARTLAHPRPVDLQGLPVCWAAGAYEGAVVRGIHEWKESGTAAIAQWFAPALAHTVVLLLGDDVPSLPVSLVPIASSAAAQRRRGFGPIDDLVQVTAERLERIGVRTIPDRCLQPSRARRDQAGLDVNQRQYNMADSMRCLVPPRGPVVIVDDIVTTGATLREAVRVLQPECSVLGCAVLAATAKRHGSHRLTNP